jgi:tetratricopeptide (TPR) repeat protein
VAAAPESPGVARALALGVAALLAARLLAAYLPGRALWGLDLGRDLPLAPWLAGLLVTGAALLPAVGARLARAVPDRAAWPLGLAGAVLLAAFVWNHPDRALYTGDTRLRQGSFVTVQDPQAFAQQALPGDLLLHHALPRALSERLAMTPGDVGRAQGSLLALLTALAGLALAHAAGARGLAALAAAAIACGSAALALDTGYAKAVVEVAAMTSVLAVGLVREARGGNGLAIVGLALALALPLHRSALALVPAWLAAVALCARRGGLRRPAAIAGVLVPLAVLLAMAPRLWGTIASFDRAQHWQGLAAVLAPAYIADVANALLLLAPLAALLPVLLALPPRLTRAEAGLAASLVLPPLALLAIATPQQGLPRDWDVFALVGSACAALAAWRVGALFAAHAHSREMALALALAALVPALQWTALQSDAARLWKRAESILVGPPERDREERALGLATIGLMRYDRGEREEARRLFRLSQQASPHPRRLVEWGLVASLAGRPAEALEYYEQAAAIKPDLVSAWNGVLESAGALGDTARVRAAVHALERLDPSAPVLPEARAWLGERASASRHAPGTRPPGAPARR